MFLDPKQPLHSCVEKNCDNCDVSNELNCHFSGKQLIKFLLIAFPFFIYSGIILFSISKLILVIWVVSFISYFGFIEIRAMCSHCRE